MRERALARRIREFLQLGAGDVQTLGGLNNSSLLIGTTTNDNAPAGVVGEYVTGALASGAAVSLVTSTAKDVVTISLTPGDWDVTGIVDFLFATTTNTTDLAAGTSTTLNTLGPDDTYVNITYPSSGNVIASSLRLSIPCPVTRYSLAATTTLHLVAFATFTVSTTTAFGTIRARRVR